MRRDGRVMVWLGLSGRGDGNWQHLTFIYFPGGSESKDSACNVGDKGSTPGSGRSPEEGNNNPLQYSCLGNPMDRVA